MGNEETRGVCCERGSEQDSRGHELRSAQRSFTQSIEALTYGEGPNLCSPRQRTWLVGWVGVGWGCWGLRDTRSALHRAWERKVVAAA